MLFRVFLLHFYPFNYQTGITMKLKQLFSSLTVTLALAGTILLTSCSKSEDKCSNASNVNDPECQKSIPDITDRPLTLDIAFKDSNFYDQNSQSWNTIKKINLDGGVMGQTLPIYSNFLNISMEAALAKIILANDQFARQSAYPKVDYSRIPYIEVAYEEGVDYIYAYVKRDLNNNIIFETTGQMQVINGRAILPFVNASFSNQFYSSDTQIGSRFIHSIAIAAQSKNKKGTKTANIEFETTLQIPNTTFFVEYADDVKNYTLKNRWNYYYNQIDTVANEQFKFLTLKEIKDISEQIPLDLKVVFQEPPQLKIQQENFFEMPLDLDALKANSKVVPQRGYSFYVQKGEFNSTSDFKMKIRMNNQFVALQSQREFEVLNLPPGTPWNMEFFYDFTQSPAYNGGNGKPLLTPMKPICNEIANTEFSPLQESQSRQTAIQNGSFISICHPKTNGKLIIPADQVATTTYDLSDTWYDYFSYYPFDDFKKEIGHLFGLRRVTFIFEGCLRVYVRQPGTSNWELKSQSSAACEQEGETGGGWVYFYAEKQATVFDNLADFEGVSGLKSLMQFFGSRPVRQTPNFYFNGDLNNNRHIY